MPDVSLTPELESFAEGCVRSGRYGSVDAVMDAALRLLREREGKRGAFVEMLEAASREADKKGSFEVEDVIAEVDAELRARAAT